MTDELCRYCRMPLHPSNHMEDEECSVEQARRASHEAHYQMILNHPSIKKFDEQDGEPGWTAAHLPTFEASTCSLCRDATTCGYAWDGYNTDGDCLAEK